MIWQNLKKNKCPQCNGDFTKTMRGGKDGFITCKCGFEISSQRYKEIVSDMVTQTLDVSEEEEIDEGFIPKEEI